jgi:hypothetical protein
MSNRRQRIMCAVMVIASIPALIAGWAPHRGPWPAEEMSAMMAAVETIPNVNGSLVNFSSAGIGGAR